MAWVWSAVFAGLSAAVFAQGALGMSENVHYANLFRTAYRLEARQPVAPTTVDRAMPLAAAVAANGVCRDDVVRAAITVSLEDVRRRNQAADFEGWQAAVDRGLSLLRHAAACNPGDGARWALLAALEREVAEQPDRLARILTLSARLSPSEFPVLRTRLSVWRRVSPATLAAARGAFDRDIATFVAKATDYDLSRLLRGVTGPLRQAVVREAAKLPRQRLDGLVARGLGFLEPAGPHVYFDGPADLIVRPR